MNMYLNKSIVEKELSQCWNQ